MGFAAPLMMLAGTGLSALSAYGQGQAAAAQARAQAQLSEHSARVADANAVAIEQKTTFDQVRAIKAGRRAAGRLRASFGEAGAVVSEGAPADVLAEQGFESALNVALIGHEGIVGAARQRNLAAVSRVEASNLQTQAGNLEQAGGLGALTQLGSGLGEMFLLTGFA